MLEERSVKGRAEQPVPALATGQLLNDTIEMRCRQSLKLEKVSVCFKGEDSLPVRLEAYHDSIIMQKERDICCISGNNPS